MTLISPLFRDYFPGSMLLKPELVSLLKKHYPDAKQATIDWRIYDLVQQGLLVRRGRGRYQLVSGQTAKSIFTPDLPAGLSQWGKKLKEDFPILTPCLWATSLLHPFVQQQPFITYWLIETDREAVDPVLNYIKSMQSQASAKRLPVIRADDLTLMERYRPDVTTLLLIKPLISEAPVQQTTDELIVPTAEKILVDLLADTDVFNLFGEELPRLFAGLNERYVLNIDRLRRYARRRHKLPDLNHYLAGLPA